jgi:hypothetical protein
VVPQDIRQSGYTFLSTIKPALTLLETAMTSLHPSSLLSICSSPVPRRARVGPAKKTPPLHPEDLATVFSTGFPVDDTIGLTNPIDPIEMLTTFRSLIEYHTLCRFSCFNKLKVKYFELVDNNILITFLTAKNDQLHRGQCSCLSATPHSALCPVRIMKVYFRRFCLNFGAAAKDESFENFNSGVSLVTPFLSSTRPSAPLLQRKICRPFLQNTTLTTRARP